MLVRLLAVSMIAAVGWTAPVPAQDYPTQPIRMVVPYAPGGGNDVLARMTAEYLTESLGQSVVVDNRPGGGSSIGVNIVAQSEPDGYTIMFTAADGISLLPAVREDLPYQVPDDFSYIAMVTDFTYVVTVASELPIHNLSEFIDYARENPGRLRYGSAGIGGAPHLATLLLADAAGGLDLVHVPFGGIAPALQAAAAGDVDIVIASPFAVSASVEAGVVRPIVLMDSERHALYPDLPTTAEEGMPDLVVRFFQGIMGPTGIPEPIRVRLRDEIQAMLQDSEIVERLASMGGYVPRDYEGEAFKEFVRQDLERWTAIAQAHGIEVD